MPPLPSVTGVIKIKITGNDNADNNIQNSWYMSFANTASAADLSTLMGVTVSAWSANIAAHHTPTYHLTGVQITDLTTKTAANVAETVSVAGTNAGTETPSGVATVISRKESDAYRGGHSRIYLGGRVQQDLADMNTWSTLAQSAIATAWQTFIQQIISAAPSGLGALRDVVLHRYGPSTLPPLNTPGYDIEKKSIPLDPPVYHPVTGYVVNPQVASQRRRNQQSG